MDRDPKRFPHRHPAGYYSGLEVCESGAGFYIGRMHWTPEYGGYVEPGTRESAGYWARRDAAQRALDRMTFELRRCVENTYLYADGAVPAPVTTPHGFGMQVRVPTGEWRWVHCSGRTEKPYAYPTADAAARMLDICYPDQCRAERLAGRHPPYMLGDRVRVAVLDTEGDWP
jgi:hypothetical protein